MATFFNVGREIKAIFFYLLSSQVITIQLLIIGHPSQLLVHQVRSDGTIVQLFDDIGISNQTIFNHSIRITSLHLVSIRRSIHEPIGIIHIGICITNTIPTFADTFQPSIHSSFADKIISQDTFLM
eukprot:15869_1